MMENYFKLFFKRGKAYIDYLMKVDFKELFVNVVILFCMIVLSAFMFIPVGIVQDVIRSFIQVFGNLPITIALLYDWIFYLLSFIFSIIAFVYLFNKRFEDLDAFKKQVKEGSKKDKDGKSVKKDDKKDDEDELDLPKAKEDK